MSFTKGKLSKLRLSEEGVKQLENEGFDKKAIPSLDHKWHIMGNRRTMESLFEEYDKSIRLNHGRCDENKQFAFESSLLILYDDIKEMALDQVSYKNSTESDQRAYRMLKQLELHAQKFGHHQLVFIKNFLIRKLHVLNITNLLKEDADPFEDFLRQY